MYKIHQSPIRESEIGHITKVKMKRRTLPRIFQTDKIHITCKVLIL